MNVCQPDAPSERISLRASSSTSWRPTRVLTRAGKKQIAAAVAIFDSGPNPNQTMNSGARTTFGSAWKAMM
jgi:hypothetical protein